jgi:hypothetical protein
MTFVWALVMTAALGTWDPHVRATAPGAQRLVDEGAQRSAIVRALIDRLEASDVVVYVSEDDAIADGVAGQLTFVSAVGGRRYVRVRIRHQDSRDSQVAILGHELQHAVEIAGAPEVIDQPSMATFYTREGTDHSYGKRERFDTQAAIDCGRDVLSELSGARTRIH